MKKENLSMIIYVIIGIVMGYVSFILEVNYIAAALAVVIMFLAAEVLKRILNINEKFKWFWSNGGWLYLFVWFVTWIIFFNL
jgi:hypothetical protein